MQPMNMKQAANKACWFLLGLLFSPEDGGDIFLKNISQLSTDYTALYPRRQNSS
jgi:hypothetical protein